MARFFSNEPNELRLHDNLSASTIVLFYRTPTAQEQAGYTNGMTKRVRNKLINCTGEQRQVNGLAILTGFREGDFLKPGPPESPHYDKEQKGVVFSSNPESPKYDPSWKKLVGKYAPDLVEALAIHAFEQTSTQDDGVDLDGAGSDPD